MNEIFVVIFVLFSIVSAIVRAIKESKEKAERAERRRLAQAQRQKGGRQQPADVSTEITDFLNTVTGQAAPPAQRPQNTRPAAAVGQARPKPKPKSSVKSSESIAKERRRKAAANRRRKTSSSKTGSRISQHVNKYITQHVDEYIDDDVEEYVEATIIDPVRSEMGKRQGPALVTKRKQNKTAQEVVAFLRAPNGVRNAILVNEVLNRPKVLRK